MNDFLEIFTLVTGLVYVVMQILQHRYMWYANLVTASGGLAVACVNHFWAYAFLNLYFIVMAFVGIRKWRKFKTGSPGKEIHIVRMDKKISIISMLIFIVGSVLVCHLLSRTNDPSPIPDGLAFVLSMIASWWLTRSYVEQWLQWILADAIYVWMYIEKPLWGMALLYILYIVSAVIGYVHWKKRGVYVEEKE